MSSTDKTSQILKILEDGASEEEINKTIVEVILHVQKGRKEQVQLKKDEIKAIEDISEKLRLDVGDIQSKITTLLSNKEA